MVATRIRIVALFALALLLTIATGAAAEDIDRAEFSSRVEQAKTGDVSGLQTVTAIDGAPFDAAVLLSGSTIEREARLDTLQRSLQADPSIDLDAGVLQEQAESIVTNPPYSAAATTGNSILARIMDSFARLLGTDTAQGLALIIVAAVALAVAIPLLNRVANRRQRVPASITASTPPRPDYAAAADNAAARGEFAEAVRLLFRDGVDHLESARIVADAGTTTTATVREISGSERFLDRFDEIAYGGSPAGDDDVGAARSGWERVKRRWQ